MRTLQDSPDAVKVAGSRSATFWTAVPSGRVRSMRICGLSGLPSSVISLV